MPLADANSFDALSNHSGEYSPTRPSFENVDGGAADAMLVDPPEANANDVPRFTSSQKGKQKMARVRSASEASLSPPPPATRPFAAGTGADNEPALEEGQNVHYPPYNIMEDDDDVVMNTNEHESGGGFMSDARKSHTKGQTLDSMHNDFQLAIALQEEEANALIAEDGREPRTAAERTFASVVRSGPAAAGGSKTPAPAPDASSAAASSSAADKDAQAAAKSSGAPNGGSQSRAQSSAPSASLYVYKGGATKDDLLVAEKDGLAVYYWPPSFPHPQGPTFNTLTLFLSDENRAGWRNLKGHVLIAYPADIGHADVDELVYTIRLVCTLALKNPKAVKVFPADRNGDYQAPVALIVCSTLEYYLWLRNQMVINNTRRPFFVISRSHPPARITHTVTGASWENDKESKELLEKMYRDEARLSTALGIFADANHDAVDKKVKDFHNHLANSITATPLDVCKKGTQTPAVYWRIECARVTRNEEVVKELNPLIKSLPVTHTVYGTPQPIQALKCGMCGDLTHMLGKCTIASHPTWAGERPKTANSAKAAAEAVSEEDETLPNGNMRTAAAKIKEAATNKGGKADKNDKKKGRK